MRTLILSLVAVCSLVVSAEAQTSRNAPRKTVLDRDRLYMGIDVDMTQDEVAALAAGARLILVERSDEVMIYRDNGVRLNTIRRIFFSNGKARAISCTISSPPEHQKWVGMIFDGGKLHSATRARSVSTDNGRTVMTHTTTDGRTMRMVWTRPSATHVVVEAAIESPDDGPTWLR